MKLWLRDICYPLLIVIFILMILVFECNIAEYCLIGAVATLVVWCIDIILRKSDRY